MNFRMAPRHAELGVVGMRGDDEDVEHGDYAAIVDCNAELDRITG